MAAAAPLVVMAWGQPATASTGVAIDIGAIDVSAALVPGRVYTLPTITVRNPGTEASGYRMEAAPVLSSRGRPLRPNWFRFEPSRFELQPGRTQAVRVRLKVASAAPAGQYEGLLKAELASVSSGNVVGGAAAARVSFHVRLARSLGDRIWHFVTDHAVLFAIVVAIIIASASGFFLRRRFTLRIERRPG